MTRLAIERTNRAVAHRAQALGAGPVGVHPLPVRLVLLDADIGGQQPGQEDDPVLRAVRTRQAAVNGVCRITVAGRTLLASAGGDDRTVRSGIP